VPRPPPDHVKLALERVVVGNVRAAADEELLDDRLRTLRGLAEHAVVGRDLAPAQEGLALVAHDLLEQVLAGGPATRVVRQEHDADTVRPCGRELDAHVRARLDQETVRQLHQDARAVSRVLLAAGRAAVFEVQKNFEPVANDARRLAPLQIDHEADAAGVVLVSWIVEALRERSFRFHG
jgi:hypothetical protein